jgi:hypothetical protein
MNITRDSVSLYRSGIDIPMNRGLENVTEENHKKYRRSSERLTLKWCWYFTEVLLWKLLTKKTIR